MVPVWTDMKKFIINQLTQNVNSWLWTK